MFVARHQFRPTTIVVLALALISSAKLNASFEATPKDRLMKEYPQALERLGAQYHHFHGSATETVVKKSKSGVSNTLKNQIDFSVDGPNIKISKVKEGGNVVVRSANAKYAFRAEGLSKGDPLALRVLQDRNGHGEGRSIESFRRDFLLAPFSVRAPINEFLWDPKRTTIGSVRSVEKDGRRLIRVEYTKIHAMQHKPIKFKCWLLLDPDQGWVLVEQDTSAERGAYGFHTRIDYGLAADGVPLPKQVEIETSVSKYTYSFDDFSFTPTPEGEFTLTSVGLPETALPGETNVISYFWLFNLVSASLLLATVILLRRPRLSSLKTG